MSPRILVVEDDSDNGEYLVRLLEETGFQTLLATTAAEAIRIARRERPDLVLMDVRLAEGDGRAAARELKAAAETAAIPIVAVTALALEGDREACLAAGCDDYLSKPFRPRELLAKMRTLLGPR